MPTKKGWFRIKSSSSKKREKRSITWWNWCTSCLSSPEEGQAYHKDDVISYKFEELLDDDDDDDDEEFTLPITPPDELEIDDVDMLKPDSSSASLVKTIDHVMEVFTSAGRRRPPCKPLKKDSNWKTIQKLVITTEEVDVETEETEENLTVRTNPDLQSDEEELEIPSTITSLYLPEQSSSVGSLEGELGELKVKPLPVNPQLDTTGARVPFPSVTKSAFSKVPTTMDNNKTKSPSPTDIRSRSYCSPPTSSYNELPNKQLFITKSLNNITFSEKDYDIAAV